MTRPSTGRGARRLKLKRYQGHSRFRHCDWEYTGRGSGGQEQPPRDIWQPGSMSASYATGPGRGEPASPSAVSWERTSWSASPVSATSTGTPARRGKQLGLAVGTRREQLGRPPSSYNHPPGTLGYMAAGAQTGTTQIRDDDPTTDVDDVWDFGTSRQYPALYSDSGERPSSPILMPSPTPTSAPTPASSPAPTVRPTLTHQTASPVANESPRLTPQPEPVPTITVPLTPTRAPTFPSESAEGEGNGQAWLIALIIIATIVCITGAATYVHLRKR